MKISVVIPCLNEEKNITSLIDALEAQDFKREDYEIIIADNGSNDRTYDVASASSADKVVVENNKGTNNARQAGYSASRGEIIAFLDADCRPFKGWLKNIWEIFEKDKNNEIGIASGPYRYTDAGLLGRFLSDIFQVLMIPALRILDFIFRKKWAIALGGNMAIRKEALEKIGGFDVSFVFFGDDADTALRIRRSGYKAIFSHNIAVESSARRFKKKGLLRTELNYVKAYLKLYFKG
ncbi:MAG: glycosyltransferase [Candidatus Colwellbacteria bacterium]|nr:glycosyltransferase [Candidatus Colwellbacteria bacterium]MCK9497561.1 glycosyltransferase [Candidatus Colwellbacteria bacterium]